MAIDPSIALAVRPVQIPQFNIQSPVDRLAQVLSLRNLMTQGQLGQLGLQSKQLEIDQLRLEAQQRANIASLMGQPQTQASAATQPVPSGAYQEPNLTRPAGPEGRAPVTAAPDQTIPLQTAPFGLTGGPESVPGLPNVGALPSPPPGAPLSALMTQPQTAPAVTAPAATPAAASPAAAGPALVAAPMADPFAGLPSTADLIRVGGATGLTYAENIAKAKKTYYENLDSQHKAQLANINDMATIASTVHDEPTKFAAIAEAFTRKLITPEVRDQLLNHPFNKQEWDGFNTQALDAAKRGEEARAQINQKALEEQQAHDRAMRPFQEAEAASKASAAQATKMYADAQLLSDPKDVPDFIKKQAPEVQPYLTKISTLPLDEFKRYIGQAATAAKPGETFAKPPGVVEQEITTAQAKTLAEKSAEMQALQPVMQSVIRGDTRLQDLPADVQSKIAPGLISGGYQGFGKLISDAERNRLADYDKALTVLKGTQDKLKNQNTRDMMGVIGGTVTQIPWSTEHKNLQSDLLTQQQELKKFITNGSLRGVTPETLNQMFPNIWSQPEHADHQIDNLMTTIKAEKEQYLRDLGDKVIPPGLKTPSAPAQTPAAAAPAAQATGGSAGLPGKVHVKRPDGQTGYINKSVLPQMVKQGYVEIP